MTRPVLMPFKAEHIMSITDRDGLYYDWPGAIYKEKFPSYTAMGDDVIIGCAGVVIPWEGMAIAWACFTKEAQPHMLWITRTIRNMLRDIIRSYNLHRVELTILESMSKYDRWAQCLGFTREDPDHARFYTPDKQNVRRFELVK